MPDLLDRIAAERAVVAQTRGQLQRRGQGKQFSEPPFWSLDQHRFAWGTALPDREQIEHNLSAYIEGGGKGDAVVFSCVYARLRVFAGVQFLWQRYGAEPGDLFWSPELRLLRKPWPTGVTGDLLAWMEMDASFAGNAFLTLADDEARFGRQARGPSRRIVRMRPDWVTLVIGSKSDDPYALDAKVVGVIYEPPYSGAPAGDRANPVVLLPNEVCHYAPVPDPDARFRGMSWLTPVLREIDADRAATQHKVKFFQRGASLQTVVSLDKDVSPEAFDEFMTRFRSGHEGTDNAYKTLFLGGGADVTVVGTNLRNLDMKAIQGGLETRIAAAAGVHPVVVGLSEGLSGSSLNAGNYSAARRNFADGTLHHLWTVASASLENLLTPPDEDTRLAHDIRHIPFVREDAKDIAEIQQILAVAFRSLVDAGMKPDAAIEFLRSNDLSRLVGQHSGLFSVQLQPPGSGQPAIEPSDPGGQD